MSCVKCSICFLLLSTAGCLLSCEEEGNTDVAKTAPTVEDQVTFGGNSYALKDGLLRNYGATDNHYNIRFSVTDGEFTSITTSVDGIPYYRLDDFGCYRRGGGGAVFTWQRQLSGQILLAWLTCRRAQSIMLIW